MIEILITFISVLLAIAFFTIAERKLLASIQRRKGPNVIGFWGTLQVIADGVKLILKEVVIPIRPNWVLFLAAPSITFLIGMVIWVFIPFSDLNYLTNFYLFDLILLVSVVFITALIIIYSISHLLNSRIFRALINNAKNGVSYNLTKPLSINIMVFGAINREPKPLVPPSEAFKTMPVRIYTEDTSHLTNPPAPLMSLTASTIIMCVISLIVICIVVRVVSKNKTFNYYLNSSHPVFVSLVSQSTLKRIWLVKTLRGFVYIIAMILGAIVGVIIARQGIYYFSDWVRFMEYVIKLK